MNIDWRQIRKNRRERQLAVNLKNVIHIHPAWEGDPIRIESVILKKTIFYRFKDYGYIVFKQPKYPVKADQQKYLDGVTLEIYADGRLIAGRFENSYTYPNEPRLIRMDFKIPPGTKKLRLHASSGQFGFGDNIIVTELSARNINTAAVTIYSSILLLLLLLDVYKLHRHGFRK